MNRLDALCYGVMVAEGWDNGSRSWRNNNPGNLRSSRLTDVTHNGFAVFPDFAVGWSALELDLWLKCSGRSKSGVTPETSLYEFVKIYACPPTQEEHDNYVAVVMKWSGARGDAPMSWFLDEQP